MDLTTHEDLAPAALKYIDLPYYFLNFDLNDHRGLYCSALVWLSAYPSLSATGLRCMQKRQSGFTRVGSLTD